MRLIDADTTIPMIKYATTDNEIGVFPIKIGFDDIVKVLNAQPTVEAIPVEWIEEKLKEINATAERASHLGQYSSALVYYSHSIALNELLKDWAERKEE